MKILFDINHPKDVHLFKKIMSALEKEGHDIKITSKGKDVTNYLLDVYGFEYENLGKHNKGLFKKIFGLVEKDIIMLKIARSFKPDIFLSLGSPYSPQISALLRKTSIVMTDTEHSIEQYLLYAPFATEILTPECFQLNLGRKQTRFNGYIELAYLHPNHFEPDPTVLSKVNLSKGEIFSIVRFVSWSASHDIGKAGFSLTEKRLLVETLERYGKVLISSEGSLPKDLKHYATIISPEDIHSLMHYAALYVGEGSTMAMEAALLGTPAVYVSSLAGKLGYILELEMRYELLFSHRKAKNGIKRCIELLGNNNIKTEWSKKRERLLNEKIDVTQFILEKIYEYEKVCVS